MAVKDALENFSNLYISNSVFTGKTDSTFDLSMIFKFFKIDEFFVKIQFNNKQKDKGGESDCKTFYNQITFSMSNKANVKLFSNGNFQISGVKGMNIAKDNLQKVLGCLPNIRGVIEVVPVMINKICCYNDKVLVENNENYKCSAVYKNGFFIVDGEVCVVSDFDDRILVSNRHFEKKKKLYNINCEYIGFIEYVMKRKNKNLCLKGAYFTKQTEELYLIHDKYVNNIPIGELHLNISGKIVEHRSPETVKVEYSACKKNTRVLETTLANINCNIKYLLKDQDVLDRESICSYLTGVGIKYNYDPCKYPGVKIDYENTKVTIFRTGSILFSGKKEIKQTISWIAKIFDENNFVKKINVFTEQPETPEISIWDIL